MNLSMSHDKIKFALWFFANNKGTVQPAHPFSLINALVVNYLVYRNDPKFWDKQVWANSADPDQTAPRGAV